MRKNMNKTFLQHSAASIALACLLLPGHSAALEFKQVQANESRVTFDYKQMGVPLQGQFNKFAAQLAFDPAKLANAKARIDIDVASIDTGSKDADEEVVRKLWFNAQAYPLASFVATGIKALGGNRYEASGKLSIKGRTLDVVTPVTFQADGAHGVFEGAFAIKRLDYAIGEGEWTDVGTVADEVQIRFKIVVLASPARK